LGSNPSTINSWSVKKRILLFLYAGNKIKYKSRQSLENNSKTLKNTKEVDGDAETDHPIEMQSLSINSYFSSNLPHNRSVNI